MNYIPHTPEHKAKILGRLGLTRISQLFDIIRPSVRLERALELPPELSEHEVVLHMEQLASKNLVPSQACFLGAGAYQHDIPSVVDTIFPLIVEGALMVEPTETESLETMERFAQTMLAIATEDPEVVKSSPHLTPVSRLDEVRAARKPVLRWEEGLN